MSLVEYALSSDEESGSDEEEIESETVIQSSNGNSNNLSRNAKTGLLKGALSLPTPRGSAASEKSIFEESDTLLFGSLPLPKAVATSHNTAVAEEDDEFLHKKECLQVPEKPPPPVDTATKLKANPVKITIPSLKEFSDVDRELANKSRNDTTMSSKKCKTSGLLSILPEAKSERDFKKDQPNTTNKLKEEVVAIAPKTHQVRSSLIPDAVKHSRPAQNTEGIESTARKGSKKVAKNKVSLVNCGESDDEDEDAAALDNGDFFSLKTGKEDLPKVSVNEINALVAKRAAEIAETTSKYLSEATAKDVSGPENTLEDVNKSDPEERWKHKHLDDQAMQALVGSSAKRRKQQQEEIQVMDLSSEEVLPNREEWMRTALASSTAYQPTGVLVDEEPAAGTRRKHQITYLAHKAKANEAELQAMWAANRHNRRATQSKYGF